jgi:hypothetical protein
MHLANPALSMIKIMPFSELRTWSPEATQILLADQHVVLTGLPVPSYGFDRQGLRTLARPDKVIPIHGMS